jgi:hypothetical protein
MRPNMTISQQCGPIEVIAEQPVAIGEILLARHRMSVQNRQGSNKYGQADEP